MQSIETMDLVVAVTILGALLLLGLLASLLHLYRRGREWQTLLEMQRSDASELLERLNAMEKERDRLAYQLDAERIRLKDREQQFDASRQQLKLEFESLANKLFDDKARAFDKSSKNSIESMLKPFREQVEGFQKRVNDVHSESLKGHASLEAEIKKVLEVGLKMGTDAQNLTSALKGESQRRGSWGETQLEKTLQMSGLIEDDHYEKQSSLMDADGRRRQTDFLIKLPDGKHIVIDSKVSLAAYDRAVAADNEEQINLSLRDHVKAVKSHILDLQSKDYSNLIGLRSPSFVLMFMPIEPAYIEALKFEKDLFAFGYERGIVLVSHTTLIPILRTVSNLWAMERSTREARELGDRAGDIYNQVRKVTERLDRLGGSLRAVTNHYNATVKSISGRQGLAGKVERFGELSAKVTQAIPEIEPIHSDLQHEALDLVADPIDDAEHSGEQKPVGGALSAT